MKLISASKSSSVSTPDEFFISVIGIATVCDDSGNCRTRDLCEGSAVWADKADCDTF